MDKLLKIHNKRNIRLSSGEKSYLFARKLSNKRETKVLSEIKNNDLLSKYLVIDLYWPLNKKTIVEINNKEK